MCGVPFLSDPKCLNCVMTLKSPTSYLVRIASKMRSTINGYHPVDKCHGRIVLTGQSLRKKRKSRMVKRSIRAP
jgi:hypothetical protein